VARLFTATAPAH